MLRPLSRRGFLGSLAAVAATAAFDPDLALWVPGQKTYFDIQTTNRIHVGHWVRLTADPVRYAVEGMNRYALVNHGALELLTHGSSGRVGIVTGVRDGWHEVQLTGRAPGVSAIVA